MSFYDYRCDTCDIVEEKRHSMSEDPEYRCEKCGELMHKVFSIPAAPIVKGAADNDFPRSRLEEGKLALGERLRKGVDGSKI